MSVRPLSEDFMAGVKANQTKETAQAKQDDKVAKMSPR
jgi:hypothetical protein